MQVIVIAPLDMLDAAAGVTTATLLMMMLQVMMVEMGLLQIAGR